MNYLKFYTDLFKVMKATKLSIFKDEALNNSLNYADGILSEVNNEYNGNVPAKVMESTIESINDLIVGVNNYINHLPSLT